MKALSARNLLALASSLLFFSCGGSGGPAAPAVDPLQSSFTVDTPFGQLADGASTVGIEVVVADTGGNAVAGASVRFLLTGFGNVLSYDLTTDANGRATGTLATRVAERKTLTCLVDSGAGNVVLGEVTVEFVRLEPTARFLRTGGSDAADGRTPLTAWRTLDHALGQVGPGQTLYIGAGEYAGGWSLLAQAAGGAPLTLFGDRDGTHTGDAGDVVVQGAGMPYGLELVDCTNVVLRGLDVRGSDPGTGLSLRGTQIDVRIVDCELYENESGITTEDAEGLLIEGCTISNNTGDGLVLGATVDSSVLSNLIYNNDLTGVVLTAPSTNVMFAGNTFYRNGGDHFREEQSGGTGTVSGNIFVEGGSLSVRLVGSGFQRSNNLIYANQGDPGSPGDVEADPLFVDPFGSDGVLGGVGAADDDFRVLATSPVLDAGLETAADTDFPFTGPATTRTSLEDGTPDGTGTDGAAVNLGFHAPIPLETLENLAPGDGRLAYALAGEAFVNTRSLDADGWSEGRRTHAANQGVKWVVQRARSGEQPDEAQAVLVDTGTRAQLFVRTWDGRHLSEDFTHPIPTNIRSGDTDERGFDIEFEALSGDLLLVHAGTDATPLFRVWRGGTWTDDAPVFDLGPLAGTTLWVQLVARPGTDEVALVTLDDQMRVIATVWDGDAWSQALILGTEIVTTRRFRAFDAAWETLSGDLLVAWGFSVFAEQTRYATRNGASGSWTTGQFTSTDAIAAHLRMHSDPTSDRIVGIFGEGDDDDDITASIWDGGAWTDTIEFTLNGFASSRAMQAAWLGDSGEAIAIFRDGDLNGDLNWALFQNGWRVQPQVFLPGPGRTVRSEIVQHTDGNGVSVLSLDQKGDLYELVYEGGKWSLGNDGEPLATGLDETNVGRAFSMARR